MSNDRTFEAFVQSFRAFFKTKIDKRTKVSQLDFVAVFVFSFFGATKDYAIEGLRRHMVSMLNIRLAKSSFWSRLSTQTMKNLLENILYELIGKFSSTWLGDNNITEKLGVDEILLVDSTSISLWNKLSKIFKGTFTSAGLKGHVCINLFSGMIRWMEYTATSVNDNMCFPDFSMLVNKLIIFDLGYWNYETLFSIDSIKGFFLTRVKKGSKILIENIIDGLRQRYIGRCFSSLDLKRKTTNIIEFIGTLYSEGETKSFRVIGFWNPEDKIYHWYITNLTAPAIVIYPLYRLRWRIELFFKSDKRIIGLDCIPTTNPAIAINLFMASMIASIVSAVIYNAIAKELQREKEKALALSLHRIKSITCEIKNYIIETLRKPTYENFKIIKKVVQLLSADSFDPNYRTRKTSLKGLYEVLCE